MAFPVAAMAPAAIGAIGQVATGLLGGFGQARTNAANAQAAKEQMAFQQRSMRQQMDFSASQAKQQMDFQRDMSSSSYQRQVEDLRKAGLNPALAYGAGGAQSGAGAMGTVSSAQGAMAERGNVIGAGMQSALSFAEGLQRIKLMQAQGSAVLNQASASVAQAMQNAGLSQAQIADLMSQQGLRNAQIANLGVVSGSEKLRQEELRASSEFWRSLDKFGPGVKGLGVILQLLRGR